LLSQPHLDATVLILARLVVVTGNRKCRAISAYFNQFGILRLAQLAKQRLPYRIRAFERERDILVDRSDGVSEATLWGATSIAGAAQSVLSAWEAFGGVRAASRTTTRDSFNRT
jgi:hypothetical protein